MAIPEILTLLLFPLKIKIPSFQDEYRKVFQDWPQDEKVKLHVYVTECFLLEKKRPEVSLLNKYHHFEGLSSQGFPLKCVFQWCAWAAVVKLMFTLSNNFIIKDSWNRQKLNHINSNNSSLTWNFWNSAETTMSKFINPVRFHPIFPDLVGWRLLFPSLTACQKQGSHLCTASHMEFLKVGICTLKFQ